MKAVTKNRWKDIIRDKLTVLIVGVLAILLAGPFIAMGSQSSPNARVPFSAVSAGYASHNPIDIDGNDDFTPANGVVSGSGTADDPYVIENWDISAENAHGIWINNTTSYLIIRNCYIHDGKGGYYSGIRFDDVKNGKIENVKGNNNWMCINLSACSNIIVKNCTLENNVVGIAASRFSHSIIENCTVSNNGYGISLGDSPNNIIRNCILENNGYGISLSTSRTGIRVGTPSENNHIYHNNFVNNVHQASQMDNVLPNYWDNGYPSGGNYWSDYTDTDDYRGENQNVPGSDGIGDTPYKIPTFEPWDQIYDRYPLMNPIDVVVEPPSQARWPLIAGIVGIIVIIGVAVFSIKRR